MNNYQDEPTQEINIMDYLREHGDELDDLSASVRKAATRYADYLTGRNMDIATAKAVVMDEIKDIVEEWRGE